MSRASFTYANVRLSTTFELRTVSESNERRHWRKRQWRAKAQRQVVAAQLLCVRPMLDFFRRIVPGAGRSGITVTLTRIASKELDSDNLAGAFKAVRDEVAEQLGVDDGDKRLAWIYGQEGGSPQSVRIEIQQTAEGTVSR